MISSEFDIEEDLNTNYQAKLLKKVNNILITEEEIALLNRFQIDVSTLNSMNDLLFLIKYTIDNLDEEDDSEDLNILDNLYDTLSERSYYFQTNK